ncbi:hypothetical protein [Salinimicrobium sp. GXAS 041]|uniref:hypothetical protein n=1 Tax=Salinimicrobium sp. GXAS 041 TaxID=3400806 RepID=UPI003C7623C7
MSKKLLALSLFTLLVFLSCSQDDYSSTEILQDKVYNVNSGDGVTSSISMDEVGVIGVQSTSTTKNSEENPEAINIALEQIATVEPPVMNGQAMRATHVDVEGNYAYVAYNKEGSTFLGGIQIIDISDKYNPRVVEEMTATVDVNALIVRNNTLYFTGAFANPDLDFYESILGKVDVSNGRFSSTFDDVALSGQTGVDVLFYDNSIVALTGSEGSIATFSSGEANMTLQNEIPYADLRSAAFSNGKLVALSGDEGLLVLDANLQTEKRISLPLMTDAAKRTITFYGNHLLVSEGQNGAGLYNLESSAEIARLGINTLPEDAIAEEDKVTNAVSITDDYILMGNGGAGFGITKLDDNNAVIQEGVIEVKGSVNYLKAIDDYVFVASGTGFRILKMNKPEVASESFLSCSEYPEYNGGPHLNINSNEEARNYSGVATVKHLNVGAELNFCGSLNVERSTNINSHGTFNMSGSLAIGAVGKNHHLNINSNSVLRIEGSLTVYGDLNLNSGATLEFVGDDSTIHVYGNVRINNNVTILGEYTDTSNKL